MATLTAVQPTFNGVALAPVAAAGGGDKFANDGNALVYIKNASAGSITVTIQAAGTPGGLTITNPTIVIPAAGERVAGPFDPRFFNDASGFLNMTYSGVTSLTVAVIKDR